MIWVKCINNKIIVIRERQHDTFLQKHLSWWRILHGHVCHASNWRPCLTRVMHRVMRILGCCIMSCSPMRGLNSLESDRRFSTLGWIQYPDMQSTTTMSVLPFVCVSVFVTVVVSVRISLLTRSVSVSLFAVTCLNMNLSPFCSSPLSLYLSRALFSNSTLWRHASKRFQWLHFVIDTTRHYHMPSP